MNFENQIAIGPEFFVKAKRDYADFYWAICREFGQNSMDCGSTRIDITIERPGDDTILTIVNNGDPMTKEVLVDKLLALGGTGKDFQNGSVGGFGRAKEILYFCHKEYRIESGGFLVNGSGAGYNICAADLHRQGTLSRIVLGGEHRNRLNESFRRFASYAQWSGEIYLNGEKLECNLHKGSPRKTYDWGTVYTNKSIPNRVIVRINGVPMFSEYTYFDRTVIVELSGPSSDVLTSNRDGLTGRYSDQFDRFLSDLIMNKSKALKSANPTYTKFSGAKYAHRKTEKVTVSARDIVGVRVSPTMQKSPAVFSGSQNLATGMVAPAEQKFQDLVTDTTSPYSPVSSNIAEEFVLKNETTLKIPDYYRPDSDSFCVYSRKLARIWGRLLLELHTLLEHESEFSVGFVFSDDCEAQHEVTNEYGTVYYINPAEIVQSSGSRSMKKRFKLTERGRLISIAAHEFVHGLGYSGHSEDFAAKYTEVVGHVLANTSKFAWCFK